MGDCRSLGSEFDPSSPSEVLGDSRAALGLGPFWHATVFELAVVDVDDSAMEEDPIIDADEVVRLDDDEIDCERTSSSPLLLTASRCPFECAVNPTVSPSIVRQTHAL